MRSIQKIKEEKGSILIESIVGISLVTIGILGIITLLTHSSKLYNSAVNNLKATYLGAEGIEVVKNIMDTRYVNKLPSISDGWYYVDNNTNNNIDNNNPNDVLTSLSNAPAPSAAQFVKFDPANNRYGNQTGSGIADTIFRRIINVDNSKGYSDVRSYVDWSEAGSPKQIILEDNFYPWRPNLQ